VEEGGCGLLGRVVLEEAVLEDGGGRGPGDAGGAGGEAAGGVVADGRADEPGAAPVDEEDAGARVALQHGVLDEPPAPPEEGEGGGAVPAERDPPDYRRGALDAEPAAVVLEHGVLDERAPALDVDPAPAPVGDVVAEEAVADGGAPTRSVE